MLRCLINISMKGVFYLFFYCSTHIVHLCMLVCVHEGRWAYFWAYTWICAHYVSIRGCSSYGIAIQIDARHPFYSILHTTGGLSCISLTVWPRHRSQRAYLTFLQVHWQSEQDDNGRPWTLCTEGQGCDGLQLRHILILIHIKAVRLAPSHQL